MAQVVTSEFNGVVFENLLTSLVEPLDCLNKGLMGLHTGFNEDLHLPVIDVKGTVRGNVDDITGAYQPTPDLSTSRTANTSYTEPSKITLTDRMVWINNIRPNAYRSVWGVFAPSFDDFLLELQLNPKVQQAFFERITQRRSNVDAYNIWQGDTATTGATYANYDGIFKNLADIGSGTGGYVDVTPSGAAALSVTTIIGAMEELENEILDGNTGLYQDLDFKFIVSHKTAAIHRNAQISQYTGKGVVNTDPGASIRNRTGASSVFNGVPIFASVGFPDGVIMATRTNLDPLNSTLHLGLRNQGDLDYVKFGRLYDWSEEYFYKLAYSIGVAVTTPQDIYLYDVRA